MFPSFILVYSREIFLLIASILLFIGCRSIEHKETYLVKLLSQTISLPFSQMEKIHSEDQMHNEEEFKIKKYKLIHYIDTQSCSICELKTMYQWDDFLIKNCLENTVQVYCIVDTRNHNREELMEAINETYFQCEVYFDNTGIFMTANNFIPINKIFHTFLLDHNHNVVVAGNPLNNPKIEELLIETIDNMNNKSNNVLSK